MVEFLLWCIGIGLFFVYGLPVIFIALAVIFGAVISFIGAIGALIDKVRGKI